MKHETVREQFGANAESYLTSSTHAKGASLQRLLEVVPTRPNDRLLDVATGAGHTALAFAPHVARVVATDVTTEMLDLVRGQVEANGLEHVRVERADAEALPYEAASFDVVTCRIAAHHFGDVRAFLREAVRVLKPGGHLALVDNVVPEGEAGDDVNAFEAERDPSHARCLSAGAWREAFADHGLTVVHEEELPKSVSLATWAARHDAVARARLAHRLRQAEGEAAAFLAPVFGDDDVTFTLREAIVVGRVP